MALSKPAGLILRGAARLNSSRSTRAPCNPTFETGSRRVRVPERGTAGARLGLWRLRAFCGARRERPKVALTPCRRLRGVMKPIYEDTVKPFAPALSITRREVERLGTLRHRNLDPISTHLPPAPYLKEQTRRYSHDRSREHQSSARRQTE